VRRRRQYSFELFALLPLVIKLMLHLEVFALLAAEFDQLRNILILFRVLRLQLLNLLLQRHQQESFLLVFLSLLCDRCELAGDSLL